MDNNSSNYFYEGEFNPKVACSIFPVFVGCSNDIFLRNVINFGTGFLFKYKDITFFVSVDHVVHYYDFKRGMRGPIDYTPWIFSSQFNGYLWPKMIPVPHCTYYSSANFKNICQNYPHRLHDAIENLANPSERALEDEELSDVAVPDIHDITYSELAEGVKEEIFSIFYPLHPYIVPLKAIKIDEIQESQIGKIEENGTYCTGGFINNYISRRDGMFHTCVRFINKLTFLSHQKKDEFHPDELYWLSYPGIFTEKELEGISGAPLFDEEEKLCGVVVRTLHTNHSIAVYPIQDVISLMEREIQINALLPTDDI